MGKWSRKEDENEYKLSEESAETQVRELIEFYDISPDDEDPVNEDEAKSKRGIISTLDKLQRYYRLGKLENKRDDTLGFCVTQHTAGGSKITYRELKPKDKTVLDGFDDKRIYARVNALLGKLCGYGEDAVVKMANEDYRAAEALAVIFLLV